MIIFDSTIAFVILILAIFRFSEKYKKLKIDYKINSNRRSEIERMGNRICYPKYVKIIVLIMELLFIGFLIILLPFTQIEIFIPIGIFMLVVAIIPVLIFYIGIHIWEITLYDDCLKYKNMFGKTTTYFYKDLTYRITKNEKFAIFKKGKKRAFILVHFMKNDAKLFYLYEKNKQTVKGNDKK